VPEQFINGLSFYQRNSVALVGEGRCVFEGGGRLSSVSAVGEVYAFMRIRKLSKAYGAIACFALILLQCGSSYGQSLSDDAAPISAIRADDVKSVRHLIERGADVHAADAAGVTPLSVAARKGYADIAGLLIAKGAEVDAANMLGATPLLLAVEAGHKDMAVLLIARGADVHAVNELGITPLMGAAAEGRLDDSKVTRRVRANGSNQKCGFHFPYKSMTCGVSH
jgi:hypothetical protein